MKKILCILLTFIMILSLTSAVSAADKSKVDIYYRTHDVTDSVLYLDLDSWRTLGFSVGIEKIINYDYVYVLIDYDKNMFEFESVSFTDEAGVRITEGKTDTDIYVKFEFDDSLRDRPAYQDYYGYATVEFEVKKPGKVDFNITAYGIDLEGKKVDIDVQINDPITEVKEYYDIKIDARQVFVFDESSKVGGGSIGVYIPELEKFGYVKIYVDFNTEVLQYETGYFQPVAVYSESQRATATGMCFTVSWNDKYADRNDGWGYSTRGFIKSLGEGDANFSVRVEATDPEGNIIEPKVKITEPYRVVKNKADLDYIEPNESADIRHGNVIYFNGEITNGEALKYVDGNNVCIAEFSGITNFYADDMLVTNGGKFYTMFNSYVIDSMSVCVMGDTTCDGRITAADARLALRIAAKLESAEWIVTEAADMDDSGKVTAADARKILRTSAGLT